jgi:hypothetical protein
MEKLLNRFWIASSLAPFAPFQFNPTAEAISSDYTHPFGLGSPAILQAPFPGPAGKSSKMRFILYPVVIERIRTGGGKPCSL